MWVRSQDKTKLVNCEYIMVQQTSNGSYNVLGNNVPMGDYSTKEKALKVLNFMHTQLNARRKGDLINAIVLNPNINLNVKIDESINILDDVFQMPQDEEE